MSSGFGNFGPNFKIKTGVNASKAGDDASDQSSNQKIFNPMEHSSDGVPLSDLLQSGMMQSPTGFMQQSFPGGLDPGTIIYYLAQEGMNGGVVLGFGNSIAKGNGGGGGSGKDLSTNGTVSELRQNKRNINVPPEIQESTDRGAKVRKIKEKGEQHRLEILDGFPIHGALFDLAGFRLPEIKKVPTAKKQGQQMLTNDMMEQMLGQLMSMSGMLQGLMGKGGGGKNSNLGALGTIGQYANTKGVAYTDVYGNTLFFEANTKVSSALAKPKANAANYAVTTFRGGNVKNKVVVYNTGNTVNANAKTLASNVKGTINTANTAKKVAVSNIINTGISYANTLNVSKGIGTAGWGNTGNNRLVKIIQNLEPNMATALTNLPLLIQGIDTSQGVSHVYGDIVHPETYMKNAANLLSQVKTVDDMMSVIRQLQYDKKLFGQDKLANVTFIVETAYGPAQKIVDFTGNVTIKYSSTAKSNIANITKLMTNTNASFSLSSTKFVANTGNSNTLIKVSNTVINIPKNQQTTNVKSNVVVGKTTTGVPAGTQTGGSSSSGGAGSGAGNAGQNATNGNMFGKSAGVLMQMMQRLASGGEKESMNMVQKFAGGDGQQLLQILRQALNGGNPLNF